MSLDNTPEQEIKRLWSVVRDLDHTIDVHKANLRRMLVFYREAVIFYREEAACLKRGEPLRDPAINRPDCAEVILRTYRLCIRTMLGLEE